MSALARVVFGFDFGVSALGTGLVVVALGDFGTVGTNGDCERGDCFRFAFGDATAGHGDFARI